MRQKGKKRGNISDAVIWQTPLNDIQSASEKYIQTQQETRLQKIYWPTKTIKLMDLNIQWTFIPATMPRFQCRECWELWDTNTCRYKQCFGSPSRIILYSHHVRVTLFRIPLPSSDRGKCYDQFKTFLSVPRRGRIQNNLTRI